MPGLRGLVGRSLVAFQSPGFGWLWSSQLFGNASRMLEVLAQGWLVLEMTDSPFWVGASAGLRGATMTLFALPAGGLADRMDRRRLLLAAQLTTAATALAVGLLAATGAIVLWQVLLASSILGAVTAVQLPARQTLTFDVVGRRRLFNANAASFLAMSTMRVISPAVGGLVVAAAGVAGGYYMGAALALAASLLLLAVPATPGRPRRPGRAGWALAPGLEHALRRGPVRSLLLVSLVAEVFGYSHTYMLPVIARDALGVGPDGLGLLMAAGGVGGLVTNAYVTSRGEARARGRVLVLSIGGYGLFVALFAASPWFGLSLALLVVAGGFAVLYDTSQQTILQTVAPEEARGRVMGLYAFTLGFTPLGGFQVGAIAAALGAPLAVGVGGVLVALNALRLLPQSRRMEAAPEAPDGG